MPGKQVKNWSRYHKARRQGKSKKQAAIEANMDARKLRRQRAQRGRRKKK